MSCKPGIRNLVGAILIGCSSSGTYSHELDGNYELRIQKEGVQSFATAEYQVSLILSDPNAVDDHIVSIVARADAFRARVPLGVQAGEVPTIEGITEVTLCQTNTYLVVDVRWPLTKEILGYAYERLVVDRADGRLSASLFDTISVQMGGLFPAEHLNLFYIIDCTDGVAFKPRPFEAFEGGGLILKEQPGHTSD